MTESTYQQPAHQQLIGPNNEDDVDIDGESYKALIDSGSQITSITEDLWKNHPKLQTAVLTPVDITIEGAGGQNVPYLGVILISLKILGVEYRKVPAFIVRADSYRKRVPILIGTNVIHTSKRDQHLTKGQNFMQKIKDESTAWHTAYTNITSCDG